eukprot:1503517-Rhodomonas_salina.1
MSEQETPGPEKPELQLHVKLPATPGVACIASAREAPRSVDTLGIRGAIVCANGAFVDVCTVDPVVHCAYIRLLQAAPYVVPNPVRPELHTVFPACHSIVWFSITPILKSGVRAIRPFPCAFHSRVRIPDPHGRDSAYQVLYNVVLGSRAYRGQMPFVQEAVVLGVCPRSWSESAKKEALARVWCAQAGRGQ